MTLGQILNKIQADNDLTEEQLLNMDVVLDLKDATGSFRGVGTAIHDVKVDIKMIWSYMNGKRMPDPKGKPRIVLGSVLCS